jgi:hypothetical protein
MQYSDSRGVHRLYRTVFDGAELQIWRHEPGFAQRLTATLGADGSTPKGVWEVNKDNQGFRDDLVITFWRSPQTGVRPGPVPRRSHVQFRRTTAPPCRIRLVGGRDRDPVAVRRAEPVFVADPQSG